VTARSKLEVVSAHASRDKTVLLDGLEQARTARLLVPANEKG
jgi:hypothetical protein